jgi:hypothetical protein
MTRPTEPHRDNRLSTQNSPVLRLLVTFSKARRGQIHNKIAEMHQQQNQNQMRLAVWAHTGPQMRKHMQR